MVCYPSLLHDEHVVALEIFALGDEIVRQVAEVALALEIDIRGYSSGLRRTFVDNKT